MGGLSSLGICGLLRSAGQTRESPPKHQLLGFQHRLWRLRPRNSQFARIELGHPGSVDTVCADGEARDSGAEE